jgi:hypothetical protein
VRESAQPTNGRSELKLPSDASGNPTKAAAILALIVTVAALGYAGYQYFLNSVPLRAALIALGGGKAHGDLLEYWVPLSIALVALIALMVFASSSVA